MLHHYSARLVILGGAIAATLDIIFAFVFYGLRGASPIGILHSISSGILGADAYNGGAGTAALGLALHFLIAIAAAFVFYGASRRLPFLTQRPFITGPAFGVGVYAVMNFVVLPLSAFPHTSVFSPAVVVPSLLAHMVLVGLPIALCVRAARKPA